MKPARTHFQGAAACCGAGLVLFAAMLLTATTVGMWQAPADLPHPVQEDARSRTANPHGSTSGCSACHVPQTGPPRAIPRDTVDLLCLSCHDGLRATREPHPIGRRADGTQLTRPPADWPLTADRLSCLTCHDVVRQCAASSLPRGDRPNLLRVPPDGKSFCGTCHVAASAPRHNPHRMTDADGTIDGPTCRFCHTETMPFGAEAARTGDARLTAREVTLCGACHARHVDFFEPGHLGVQAPPGMLERLRRSAADPNFAARRGASATLPLDSDGRVTCSTCHNPHERGVFPVEHALSDGALSFPKSAHTEPRMRAHPPDLCGACHAEWQP
ncbi:MAG: hypothetical protein IT449_05065 [Phycisphaerales bacterium]|nr:hypothetical protein [Phycisphaerales bacterium]